jgi:RNA polymerase sigma-70 factor (ECF subfamily)
MTPDHQPEIAWITAYKKGDVNALGHLVEHFRKPLYAFIYNMLQGRGDAEEIFQEVWLRVIKNFSAYRHRNFAGWLFRIAHNLFIDRVRRESRFVPPSPSDSGPDAPGMEQVPDARPAPDEIAAHHDLGARITAALAALPDDQREIFLLRTEAGLSFKDIADLLEISLNTALSRMHYAVQKLRPLLAEDYHMLTGGPRHE